MANQKLVIHCASANCNEHISIEVRSQQERLEEIIRNRGWRCAKHVAHYLPIDIEFHERKDSPQIAIVKVGDRMVAMEIQDWLDFAKGVVERIEAHLTPRTLDAAGLCACGLHLLPDGTCPMHFQYTTPRQ